MVLSSLYCSVIAFYVYLTNGVALCMVGWFAHCDIAIRIALYYKYRNLLSICFTILFSLFRTCQITILAFGHNNPRLNVGRHNYIPRIMQLGAQLEQIVMEMDFFMQ